VLLGAFGLLLSGPICVGFLGEELFRTTDFCFIFDCQGGIFGGTIDPCTGVDSGSATVESSYTSTLLNDCPIGP